MNSLDKAKAEVFFYFTQQDNKSWSKQELNAVLEENRDEWKFAKRVSLSMFINFLENSDILSEMRLDFQLSHVTYIRPDASIFDIANAYSKGLFFTHYTAATLHELTTQNSKDIYISRELARDVYAERENIPQLNIDKAFKKPARTTTNILKINEYRIHLLNSRNTGRQGLDIINIEGSKFYYTSLERTLIDCVVRPSYSGGVTEVLSFFKEAEGKLNVNKLFTMLSKMDFAYPYHQCVGWYLSQAGGYNEKAVERFKKPKFAKAFYLCNEIKNPAFDNTWKVYYPKGLV